MLHRLRKSLAPFSDYNYNIDIKTGTILLQNLCVVYN